LRKLVAGIAFLSLAAAAVLAGFRWSRTEFPSTPAYTADNLIRLHVVANSDSDEDQALKRRVRDALLQKMSPVFARSATQSEARDRIIENLDEIRVLAQDKVRESGFDYPVNVEFGVFPFPTRVYGDTVLPAGKYQALRVVIGEGQGQNWWCVLFPPLCFVDVTTGVSTATSESETDAHQAPVLIDEREWNEMPVKVRFAGLEWLRRKGINTSWVERWFKGNPSVAPDDRPAKRTAPR
jgi:stage II sporulation protein R